MKAVLAWMNQIRNGEIPAGDLPARIDSYMTEYRQRSARLITDLSDYSSTIGFPKSEAEIRRALLDLDGDISNLIFGHASRELVYSNLFAGQGKAKRDVDFQQVARQVTQHYALSALADVQAPLIGKIAMAFVNRGLEHPVGESALDRQDFIQRFTEKALAVAEGVSRYSRAVGSPLEGDEILRRLVNTPGDIWDLLFNSSMRDIYSVVSGAKPRKSLEEAA
jgi:hypothetical protein